MMNEFAQIDKRNKFVSLYHQNFAEQLKYNQNMKSENPKDKSMEIKQMVRMKSKSSTKEQEEKKQTEIRLYPSTLSEVNIEQKFTPENAQCSLCSTKYKKQEMVKIGKCRHQCCSLCFQQYIRQEIENKQIKCPIFSCSQPIQCAKYAHFILNLSENFSDGIKYEESYMHEQELQRQQQKDNQNQEKQIKYSIQINHLQQLSEEKKSPTKTSSDYYNFKQILKINKLRDQNKQIPQSPLFDSTGAIHQKLQQNSIEIRNQPMFPKRIFQALCNRVWSNKWSKFFFMLPVSLLVLCLFLFLILFWITWVCLYFCLVWLIFVPLVWTFYQIWNCFSRSFSNIVFRTLVFVFCLIAFPIIQIFFYILIIGLVLYYKLYVQDMKEVLKGKLSNLMSLRKLQMRQKQKNVFKCKCTIDKKCQFCEKRRIILCLVF